MGLYICIGVEYGKCTYCPHPSYSSSNKFPEAGMFCDICRGSPKDQPAGPQWRSSWLHYARLGKSEAPEAILASRASRLQGLASRVGAVQGATVRRFYIVTVCN